MQTLKSRDDSRPALSDVIRAEFVQKIAVTEEENGRLMKEMMMLRNNRESFITFWLRSTVNYRGEMKNWNKLTEGPIWI